jgi:hypothetical protein
MATKRENQKVAMLKGGPTGKPKKATSASKQIRAAFKPGCEPPAEIIDELVARFPRPTPEEMALHRERQIARDAATQRAAEAVIGIARALSDPALKAAIQVYDAVRDDIPF